MSSANKEPATLQPTHSPMSSQMGNDHATGTGNNGMDPPRPQLTLRLYISHFLSTWNSRLFEFGSVLFLASIFPDTLLPMSVYALVRSGAAILFAQSVGSWIDSGNRLTVVRVSIIGQRISVVVSCGLFWILEQMKERLEEGVTRALFAMVVLLACVEKLCAVMNLVAIERDWVGLNCFILDE